MNILFVDFNIILPCVQKLRELSTMIMHLITSALCQFVQSPSTLRNFVV